eukprot:m.159530 g.159530  ORF g.159530 m.159530 type:complete len:1347 (-) comp13371_c0_seq1:60-4100(-)
MDKESVNVKMEVEEDDDGTNRVDDVAQHTIDDKEKVNVKEEQENNAKEDSGECEEDNHVGEVEIFPNENSVKVSCGANKHTFDIGEGKGLDEDAIKAMFHLPKDTSFQMFDKEGETIQGDHTSLVAAGRKGSVSLILKRPKRGRGRERKTLTHQFEHTSENEEDVDEGPAHFEAKNAHDEGQEGERTSLAISDDIKLDLDKGIDVLREWKEAHGEFPSRETATNSLDSSDTTTSANRNKNDAKKVRRRSRSMGDYSQQLQEDLQPLRPLSVQNKSTNAIDMVISNSSRTTTPKTANESSINMQQEVAQQESEQQQHNDEEEKAVAAGDDDEEQEDEETKLERNSKVIDKSNNDSKNSSDIVSTVSQKHNSVINTNVFDALNSNLDATGPIGRNDSTLSDEGRKYQVVYREPKTMVLMHSAQGFGFSCCHMIVRSIEEIRKHSNNETGEQVMTLVEFEDVGDCTDPQPSEDNKVFIGAVLEGSSADLAGLHSGDMLHSVNDEFVEELSLDDIHSMLATVQGDVVLRVSSILAGEDELSNSMEKKSRENSETLSSFFGTEANEDASFLYNVVRAGTVYVKFIREGSRKLKKRTWKEYMAALQGHVLYLYSPKDVMDGPLGHSPSGGRISVKSSLVDIAYDYKKRKHVFRLQTFNGSECLIRTQSEEDMMEWINAILANNNPDNDETLSHDLIKRKAEQKAKTSNPHTLSSSGGKIVSRGSASNILNRSLRSRLNLQLKRRRSTATTEAVPVFTQSIEELCVRDDVTVPLLVTKLVAEVEARGLDEQGIYRHSGPKSQIDSIQEHLAIDSKGTDLSDMDLYNDQHALCGALKFYFRQISPPLFTSELYDDLIACVRAGGDERVTKIRGYLHQLPPCHYDTTRFIFTHLVKVVDHSKNNMMGAQNVALVFGPTLVRKDVANDLLLLQDMSHQSKLVELLLLNFNKVFDRDAFEAHGEVVGHSDGVEDSDDSMHTPTTSRGGSGRSYQINDDMMSKLMDAVTKGSSSSTTSPSPLPSNTDPSTASLTLSTQTPLPTTSTNASMPSSSTDRNTTQEKSMGEMTTCDMLNNMLDPSLVANSVTGRGKSRLRHVTSVDSVELDSNATTSPASLNRLLSVSSTTSSQASQPSSSSRRVSDLDDIWDVQDGEDILSNTIMSLGDKGTAPVVPRKRSRRKKNSAEFSNDKTGGNQDLGEGDAAAKKEEREEEDGHSTTSSSNLKQFRLSDEISTSPIRMDSDLFDATNTAADVEIATNTNNNTNTNTSTLQTEMSFSFLDRTPTEDIHSALLSEHSNADRRQAEEQEDERKEEVENTNVEREETKRERHELDTEDVGDIGLSRITTTEWEEMCEKFE